MAINLKEKLDNLEGSVKNTGEELDDLAKKVADGIDKNTVENYQQKISGYRKELNNLKIKLNDLSGEKKQEIERQIQEIEPDLTKLEQSIEDIGVASGVIAMPTPPSSAKEKKSTKDRFLEQRKAVTNTEEWKNNKGKNLLRFIGGVGIVGGVISLFDRIFKGKQDNSEKGFWERPLGKAIKWVGIAVGAGTLRQTIDTSELTSDAKKQAEDTNQLRESDSEKYEKYKGIGENIDTQYNEVMKKEMDAGWGGMSISDGYENYADKENVDKEVFKATVPMCIDNQYSDVSHFLSEGSYYTYLKGMDFAELKAEILSWTKETISSVLGPFLINLVSFIPYKGKDWKKGLEEWFESGNPTEKTEELQLFFRQYAKVLNYTQDKLITLEEKIAEENFRIGKIGEGFFTVGDALKNEQWVEKYVYSDTRYKNFVNGKLHNAVDVMKENGIFDANLSHDMKETIASCDEERDKILKTKDGKDAIQRLNEAGTDLTSDHFNEGVNCCDEIINDIKDQFDKTASYTYFSAIHEFRNSNENNIQEFLKYSGFDKFKEGLILVMEKYKSKFLNKEITEEELNQYKNQVNCYFATKKEIFIGSEAIQRMKSENPNYWTRAQNIGSAIFSDLWNQTKGSLKLLKEGKYLKSWALATMPIFVGGAAIRGVGKYYDLENVAKFGKWIQDRNIISTSGRVFTRRVPHRNLNWMPYIVLKTRYNISNGDQLLLQDLIEGRISGNAATNVIKKGNKNWYNLKEKGGANSITEFMQKMMGQAEGSIPGRYIEMLFNNSEDIMFMKNPSLRKIFFGDPKITVHQKTLGRVWNGFSVKNYSITGFSSHANVLEEFILGVNGNSPTFQSLTKEQKSFAKQLLESGNFKKAEDITAFIDNVRYYDLNGFDDVKISSLVDELIDCTDQLGDPAAVKNKLGNKFGKKDIFVSPKALPDGDEVLSDVKKALKTDLEYVESNIKRQLSLSEGLSIDDIVKKDDIPEVAKNQLKDIDNFKKALNSMDDVEIQRLTTLLGEFKKAGGGLGDAIEQLALLRRIQMESAGKVFETGLLDAHGNPITRNFDDIVKNMNDYELKALCRQLGISDDVEPLAKTFRAIREGNAHKLIGTSDEIFESIGKLMKYFAKLT